MKSIHLRRLDVRVEHTTARILDYATRNGLAVADLAGVRLPWYAVRNQAGDQDGSDTATVFVFEEIGGSVGISAKTFAEDLEAITAPKIALRINSPGGSVRDSVAIHSSLLHHPAKVRTYVDGLAASGASVVAMAADPLDEDDDWGGIVVMPGGQMMIHDASMVEDGTAADMGKAQVHLDRQSQNIAAMYQMRAGGDVEEWRERMLAESWFFGDEAVEARLADRVERRDDFPAEPEMRAAMTRRFDRYLRRYRYAGREQAPAPARRRTATRAKVTVQEQRERSEEPMGAPTVATDRAEAAAQRRAAFERAAGESGGRFGFDRSQKRGGERVVPGGLARVVPVPVRELRARKEERNGQMRYHVYGYATAYELPYAMWDEFGPYDEIMDRRAFVVSLGAGPDTAFLTNHRGLTMARTIPGPNGALPTLELGNDTEGMPIDAWLNPARQDVKDLVTAIDDGDITEMSLAFMLREGWWSDDFMTFRIIEADIDRGDVSAVNYGANPYTSIQARQRDIFRDLAHMPVGIARGALATLNARQDLKDVVRQTWSTLDTARVQLREVEALDRRDGVTGRSIAHVEALLGDDA